MMLVNRMSAVRSPSVERTAVARNRVREIMKSLNTRGFLLSIAALVLGVAGCGGLEAEEAQLEAPLVAESVAVLDVAQAPSGEEVAEVACHLGDPDAPGAVAVGAECGRLHTYDLETEGGEIRSACPVDTYFHPNNGSQGGWIESWRLCSIGGNQYRICTGGYAPVRYWNMSTCGGTIHDYYPQGWSGWAQTFGTCC